MIARLRRAVLETALIVGLPLAALVAGAIVTTEVLAQDSVTIEALASHP